ncbi:MAG TPA: ankyrin repeat domain-containing protein [Pyrinomonadaceae bacterium]|nr:ankyrin repeat domain-containing protein [Pyrinomonadaceae bacterium]
MSHSSTYIFLLLVFTIVIAPSTSATAAVAQTRKRASNKQLISKRDLRELMSAAAAGNVRRVNALLDKGIDVNVTYLRNESPWSGKTALMVAAEHGQSEVIQALVRRNANVNLKHYSDLTALMLAAGGGYTDAVRVLLAAGADPNAVGFYFHYGDFTPLMFAIRSKSEKKLQVIDALIAGGAELNSKRAIRTPLMVAIENNDPDMIKALVKRGAEVNGRGGSDITPLMFAAIGGTPRVVQALLDAGADVSLRDNEGKTALALAEQDKTGLWKSEIVELLKRAGAKP